MKKQLYEQPLAEIFEVQLSHNVLLDVSNQYNTGGAPNIIGDGVVDDDEGYNG